MCLSILPADTDVHSLHAWCWGGEQNRVLDPETGVAIMNHQMGTGS